MICPECGKKAETRIVRDVVASDTAPYTWRNYRCNGCGYKFNTHEQWEPHNPGYTPDYADP